MLIHPVRPQVSTHRHRAFAVWLCLATPNWFPSPPPLTSPFRAAISGTFRGRRARWKRL